MTLNEIKSCLCCYDTRNPDVSLDYSEDPPVPLERLDNCMCDNCFYGRDRMANFMLQLIEQQEKNIKDAWEMGAAYGTAEDDILPEAVEAQKEYLARVLKPLEQ